MSENGVSEKRDGETKGSGFFFLRNRKKKQKEKKSVGQEILSWIWSLAAAVIVVMLLRTFVFSVIRVEGSSMVDTLHDGERLYVSVLTMKTAGIARGDVVICHYPNRITEWLGGLIKFDTYFVKRVVGVPGDTVSLENGVTYITYTDGDGTEVKEAIDPRYEGRRTEREPYVLGEDEYFVCGDNRYNSNDSRNWKDVGPLTKDMIVGRVRFVIWPFGSIRAVK